MTHHNDESDILGCWCFDNGATLGIEHVLHGPDGHLHVDDVAVHLVWILQMASKVLCVAHKSKSHYWPASFGDSYRSENALLTILPML